MTATKRHPAVQALFNCATRGMADERDALAVQAGMMAVDAMQAELDSLRCAHAAPATAAAMYVPQPAPSPDGLLGAQIESHLDCIIIYDVAKLGGVVQSTARLHDTLIAGDTNGAPPFELFVDVLPTGERSLRAVRCNLDEYIVVPKGMVQYVQFTNGTHLYNPPSTEDVPE